MKAKSDPIRLLNILVLAGVQSLEEYEEVAQSREGYGGTKDNRTCRQSDIVQAPFSSDLCPLSLGVESVKGGGWECYSKYIEQNCFCYFLCIFIIDRCILAAIT